MTASAAVITGTDGLVRTAAVDLGELSSTPATVIWDSFDFTEPASRSASTQDRRCSNAECRSQP
ncbi:MAG: hypothetical protein J2P19_05945, partial [Pseudonocardia sp.]|nr:hypothetical protein [Pseudonocardia sp.]